jgi:copper chaperone NosL
MPRERRAPLGAAAAVLGGAALAFLLWRAAAPPSGPVEPAWDRVACARCHMLVGEPAFAAQLHTPAGEVLFFDDPGCLLLHRDAPGTAAGAAWFHDSRGDGWLAEADARFVPAERTPMGHGFAAVAAREAADGLDADAALGALRARPAEAP